MRRGELYSITVALLLGLAVAPSARAQVRIKDIVDVEGVRANQLFGLGLVVGLDGTGGQSDFTRQLAVEMLRRLNFVTDISAFDSKTVAAVMVTADLPPFATEGTRIDVTVSAIDDTKSLQGGILLLTPLRGADGEVYAVAQGPLSVGGFVISGQAATAQKNHPTVGRIPNGAIVERTVPASFVHRGFIRLLLRTPDPATAHAMARAINQKFPKTAVALDPATVQVTVPNDALDDPVGFLSAIGELRVNPDVPARVVINERTGTIVAGQNVAISAVAVAHANLAIVTSETPEVSQPAPFGQGDTVVVPRTQVDVTEEGGVLRALGPAVTVGDLARALNALGVTPRDIIAIFQALKEAGALHAELIIM